jgi:hypothetical protein
MIVVCLCPKVLTHCCHAFVVVVVVVVVAFPPHFTRLSVSLFHSRMTQRNILSCHTVLLGKTIMIIIQFASDMTTQNHLIF